MTRRTSTTRAERARLDAEAQYAALEAERGGHEVDAPQQDHEHQAGTPAQPARCRDHPSQVVDQRSGECRLCRQNPVRQLRAALFDNAAAPPTVRKV